MARTSVKGPDLEFQDFRRSNALEQWDTIQFGDDLDRGRERAVFWLLGLEFAKLFANESMGQ